MQLLRTSNIHCIWPDILSLKIRAWTQLAAKDVTVRTSTEGTTSSLLRTVSEQVAIPRAERAVLAEQLTCAERLSSGLQDRDANYYQWNYRLPPAASFAI